MAPRRAAVSLAQGGDGQHAERPPGRLPSRRAESPAGIRRPLLRLGRPHRGCGRAPSGEERDDRDRARQAARGARRDGHVGVLPRPRRQSPGADELPMSEPTRVSEPAFWQDLYERREDGWELGQPSPPFAEYLKRSSPPRGRVAVPGCGRGHDCRLLAKARYQVWGFDFATQAIQEARALARQEGLDIVFEQRDLFDLATDYRGFFDGVWEYTCFCAIAPARRGEYVRLVREILKPEGWLLACFYPLREGTDGP